MKPASIIQEILLVTSTTFASRELCETKIESRESQLTPTEKLEAACWNGLLDQMLPEIMPQEAVNQKMFMWDVERGESYLKISMGACRPALENRFTLDPHLFLDTLELN